MKNKASVVLSSLFWLIPMMIMFSRFLHIPQLAAFFGVLGVIKVLKIIAMSNEEFDKKYNFKSWRKGEEERRAEEQQRRATEEQRRRREQESYDRERRTQDTGRENRDARERMKPVVQYPPKEQSSTAQKEALKQSGLKKYKEYDYDGAIEDFGKALAADPKDVAVHWNLTCLYSLTEQKELAFYHLQKAVELGFADFEKVKNHEALAFLRVQPEFDTFSRSGFKMSEDTEHSDILQQLKDLSMRREKGLLSEKEFADMSKRLVE